jgi:hypothetical protein
MTQGKIERYHRSLKNVVKLRKHYLPWELEEEIGGFVQYYNQQRVHESLDNVTPADMCHGRAREIQTARERLKQQTLKRRRRYNMGLSMRKEEMILPSLTRESVSWISEASCPNGLTTYTSFLKNKLSAFTDPAPTTTR